MVVLLFGWCVVGWVGIKCEVVVCFVWKLDVVLCYEWKIVKVFFSVYVCFVIGVLGFFLCLKYEFYVWGFIIER